MTHRAHVLFLLSGEHTTTRPRTMVMQRGTDNRRGTFPHFVKQKTSLSWPGSRSTTQTQIVICLGCFLTATICINDEWHANQTEWTPHTIYIDWLFPYIRGGVRHISVTSASASFQEGSRKTTKLFSNNRRCSGWNSIRSTPKYKSTALLLDMPSKTRFHVHRQGQVIVQWEFRGIYSIWHTFQLNHKIVTSPCTLRQ
jgi:hypothetical protein